MNINVRETGSIKNSKQVAKTFRSILEAENDVYRDKEHFWAIGLDTKNRIKYVELVSLGSLSTSIVHPRETFRMAIMKGVASIMVGHNHPSGDTSPSTDDLTITKRLKECGDILGIRLLDHVIIAGKSFLSLFEKGYI